MKQESTTEKILQDIDVLVPLISYLDANPYWWARTAHSLSKELSLAPDKVKRAFTEHPMIFKKARYIEESEDFAYALQMRYAQRKDGNLDELGEVTNLPVLSEAEVIALIDFLLRVSTLESSRRATRVALIAAGLSALTAIIAAGLSAFTAIIVAP